MARVGIAGALGTAGGEGREDARVSGYGSRHEMGGGGNYLDGDSHQFLRGGRSGPISHSIGHARTPRPKPQDARAAEATCRAERAASAEAGGGGGGRGSAGRGRVGCAMLPPAGHGRSARALAGGSQALATVRLTWLAEQLEQLGGKPAGAWYFPSSKNKEKSSTWNQYNNVR